MTQGITDAEVRRLSGDGATTPPALEPLSRSEGDLNRNSFRPSKYTRLAVRAVVNDDGTPISATVEELLRRLIALTESLEARETDIAQLVKAIQEGNALTIVASRLFETGLIPIPGIGTAAAYVSGDSFGSVFKIDGAPEEGVISTARFFDHDDEGLPKELWLFRGDNSFFLGTVDNVAFNLTDVELSSLIGVIDFDTFKASVDNQVSTATPALYYKAPKGLLYGQFVTRGVDNIAAGKQPEFSLVIS